MNTVNFNPFLKISAVCAVLGALTTALLIFLPEPRVEGFEATASLYNNSMHVFKKWLLFFHPQVNTIGCLGIAVLLFRKSPALIILGTIFIIIWGYTEMVQQAFLIDAQNMFWRPGYLNAEDKASKDAFFTLLKGIRGFSDSQYFVIIYGFGLGTLLFGLAMIKETQLAKYIGISFVVIGVVSLLAFTSYYLGAKFFSPFISKFYTWIYPYLQPLVRVLVGVWIFREVKNNSSLIKN